MDKLTLYRKRLIPEECILLKDDIILSADKERIITSWHALHPKKELHHGYSMYLLNEGIKVSKFVREDDSLIFWYCDIVTYEFDAPSNTLTSVDLLADVIIYPDGFVKVVDLDELVQALQEGKITNEQLSDSLLKLNRLLSLIYAGKFSGLTEQIESFIQASEDHTK